MKKNLKILSSLALAGVLTAGAIGTTTHATTTRGIDTKPVGIYKHLIEGKNVVPFVLSDKNDKITIKDIKDSGKFNMTQFNGSAVSDESRVVCTGDTFKADGKDYTVVIYGDVDKDGAITVLDANTIIRSRAFDDEKLDEIQQEAANVERADKSGVNVNDALAIIRYRAELKTELIDELPKAEQEETQPSNYTVTLNENGIVNKDNETKTNIKIQLAQELTQKMDNVTIEVLNTSDIENPILIKNRITIPAYTSQFTIENVDFSGAEEGTVTGHLKAQDGTVLTTFKFEKNTELFPEVAQIKTDRISTPEAIMSFNSCGESDIVKMYYIVDDMNQSFADIDTMIKDKRTKTINVNNSKLENITVANDLKTETAYKVYFVVENSYGNKSQQIEEAIITKDGISVKEETKVKSVKAPTLEKAGEVIDEANFEWTPADSVSTGDRANKKYIVTLFKDGQIAYEVETAAGEISKDLKAEMEQPGRYKVSVVVKGDATGTSKNSEAVESNEVEVTKLNSVTDIEFNIDQAGAKKLSWSSEYRVADIKGYEINLINETDKTNQVMPLTTSKEATLTMTPNKIYKAQITVIAKDGQLAKVSSEKTVSSNFLEINANTITSLVRTTDSVTLKVTPIGLEGATYDIEVYNITGENGDTKPRYELKETKNNCTINKDKNGNETILVDGLESNKSYAFKLIAKVSNTKGETPITAQTTTLKQMPEIRNLEVSTTKGTGKISKTAAGDLYINAQEIKAADIQNYPAELEKISNIMDTLVAKDKITMTGDKLTLVLPNEASETGAYIRDFGTTTNGMTVEIEGNKFDKTIKATAAKEIILKGTEARFNIANLTAERVVLSDSVVVTTGTNPVNIVGGATVRINDVKVTATKEITMVATGKKLDITPSNEANNLTFENTTAGDTEITFKGKDGFGSSQEGTITIKSTDGKVSIKGDKMHINSTLNIDVEKGNIDISSPTLGGNKNVNVTNEKGETTTIKAVSKTTAPEELKGKTVELKTYSTDEEKSELKTVLGLSANDELSDELLGKVQQYINSFGINGEGIKLEVENDATTVTFTFGANTIVSNVKISNIK